MEPVLSIRWPRIRIQFRETFVSLLLFRLVFAFCRHFSLRGDDSGGTEIGRRCRRQIRRRWQTVWLASWLVKVAENPENYAARASLLRCAQAYHYEQFFLLGLSLFLSFVLSLSVFSFLSSR